MGKLSTKLVNNTDKTLVIYENSSNGAQTKVAELLSPTATTITPTPNHVSEKSKSTQKLPNYSYELSVDPNDSYYTFRIWYGNESVLGVTNDELIDNSTITIEFKDGEFIKWYEPRGVRKKPASTSEGDASNKKDILGDFRNIFRNIFKSHKSANSNAGK